VILCPLLTDLSLPLQEYCLQQVLCHLSTYIIKQTNDYKDCVIQFVLIHLNQEILQWFFIFCWILESVQKFVEFVSVNYVLLVCFIILQVLFFHGIQVFAKIICNNENKYL